MVRRRKLRGIHAAADALDVDKLKRILAAGTDPNRVVSQGEYSGQTPLLVICGQRNSWRRREDLLACAAALIDAGADVNFSSSSWHITPLTLAAGWRDHDDWRNCPIPRLVSMLIAAGADVASTGQAALQGAVASCIGYEPSTRDAVRVVSMLIEAGVSVRGKFLDELFPRIVGDYQPLPNDRFLAILLRAGARVPKRLEYAVRRYSLRRPYLWNMSFAGSVLECFQSYERRCLESLTAIFAPKFTQLPEEIIPTIVLYAFHPGMYASTGAPAALTPALLERICVSLDTPAELSIYAELDAMFRAGVNPELLTIFPKTLEWVPPPSEQHGTQPLPHELKCALELHLASITRHAALAEDVHMPPFELQLARAVNAVLLLPDALFRDRQISTLRYY